MKTVIRKSLRHLGLEIRRTRRFAQSRLYDSFPRDSVANCRFYNIGAGSFAHPYWTNVDYASDHYSVVQKVRFVSYDLMALVPLPLPNDLAEIVYCSHTIEHVSDAAVRNMLFEAHRILKPGGVIRLTTPDAWLGFRAYQRRDRDFWYWAERYVAPGTWEKLYKKPLSDASVDQLFLHHFASQLCEIDIDDSAVRKYSDAEIRAAFEDSPDVRTLEQFTRQCRYNSEHPGNHINWWTHEKAMDFLREAGFEDPYRSGYGQSLFAPLRDTGLFDSTHPQISLYVEAIK